MRDEHHPDQDRQSCDADDGEHHAAAVLEDHGALGRDAGGDAGEDQQRHAVADATLGGQLAHPHHQRGACGEDQHDDDQGEDRRVLDDLQRAALKQSAVGGERHDRGGLQHGQRDGEVPGVLRHLGLAGLALLAQLFEARDDHRQQLHDDAGRDVRHDADREDRQLQQSPTREQVDQGVDLSGVTAADLLDALLHIGVVDARRRQRSTGSIQNDDAQSEEDLASEVGRSQR
jgi:hypothetical protein